MIKKLLTLMLLGAFTLIPLEDTGWYIPKFHSTAEAMPGMGVDSGSQYSKRERDMIQYREKRDHFQRGMQQQQQLNQSDAYREAKDYLIRKNNPQPKSPSVLDLRADEVRNTYRGKLGMDFWPEKGGRHFQPYKEPVYVDGHKVGSVIKFDERYDKHRHINPRKPQRDFDKSIDVNNDNLGEFLR